MFAAPLVLSGFPLVSPTKSRSLFRRFRAGVLREVPVWGLKQPTLVEGDGSCFFIQAEEKSDAWVAEGFATAQARMISTDLKRRLWSGRLSEVVGERDLASGVPSPLFDAFVRIAGFRWSAEKLFRKLSPEQKKSFEHYAIGINAWIDAGSWRNQDCWKSLGSRPRLWTPSDSLLLAVVEARKGASAAQNLSLPEKTRVEGWNDAHNDSVDQLWAACRALLQGAPCPLSKPVDLSLLLRSSDSLHWEGRVTEAQKPLERLAGIPTSFDFLPVEGHAPTLLPLQIVAEGDNQLYESEEGVRRRLHARRHDIDVRGGQPLRHWIRRCPQGGIISDLLNTAREPLAPAGQSFIWSWGALSPSKLSGSTQTLKTLDMPLKIPTGALKKTRLVPLESGSW